MTVLTITTLHNANGLIMTIGWHIRLSMWRCWIIINATMNRLFYTAPTVRELPLTVERGFAASLENPVVDPEQEW